MANREWCFFKTGTSAAAIPDKTIYVRPYPGCSIHFFKKNGLKRWCGHTKVCQTRLLFNEIFSSQVCAVFLISRCLISFDSTNFDPPTPCWLLILFHTPEWHTILRLIEWIRSRGCVNLKRSPCVESQLFWCTSFKSFQIDSFLLKMGLGCWFDFGFDYTLYWQLFDCPLSIVSLLDKI